MPNAQWFEAAELQWHIFAIQSKGDCFLSANTKLVGFNKAVQVSSEELAISFCEAVLPTLRRRHGEAVMATVATCSTTEVAPLNCVSTIHLSKRGFSRDSLPQTSDRKVVELRGNDAIGASAESALQSIAYSNQIVLHLGPPATQIAPIGRPVEDARLQNGKN